MSGHITRMSRGSSVGSSASRPSSTSRSTSTCRAWPWHACTWTDRSLLACERPCGRTALAATSDCSQPSRVSGCSPAAEVFVGAQVGRQADLQLAQIPAEGGEQRMVRPPGGWCRRGGRWVRAHPSAHARARRWDAAATGARRDGWPSASISSISVIGNRVCPNSDSRGGRSRGDSRRRATVFWWRTCGGSAVDAVDEGLPQRRLPAEVVVEVGSRRRASRRAAAGAVARRRRRAPRCDAPRRSAAPAVAPARRPSSKCPRWVASVLHHGSSRLSSITSSSGQTMASGAHGSSSAVPVISAISECGFLNSTPAHTPSAPEPRPRTWDRRWLSHRSIPRAGTRTSSVANGSSSGCERRAPRPSASRSVRSARCRCRAIEGHPRTPDPTCRGPMPQ